MDTRMKDVASRLRTAAATSSSDAAGVIKRDSSSANSTEPSDANAQLVLRVHEALLRFGSAAVEGLLNALPTATGGFQLHLIKLLGEIGDERAWEPLMDLLESPDLQVRITAARALTRFPQPEAIRDPLVQIRLTVASAGSHLVALALKPFGAYISEDPQAVLRQAVIHRDMRVQRAAYRALARNAKQSIIPELVGAFRTDQTAVCERAHAILCTIGDAAIDDLMVALSSPDVPVRACSAWTIGSIGDSRAETALIECLQDPVPRVRRAAVWALGKLKQVNTSNAIPPLLFAMDDADPVVRTLAHDSLEALGLR